MKTEDKLLAAQTALLWDSPFFGVLLLQIKRVDATDDPAINTMATDGKHLYYHRPFVDKLKKEELVFVLAHEVMHNALEHIIRRQHRKPGRWNVACDEVINNELVECKVGVMPPVGLCDKRFAGMSAEEVYRILDEENGGDDSHEHGGDIGGCGGVIDGCAPHDEAGKADIRAEIQAQVRQAAMAAKAQNAGKLPAGIQRIVDQLLAPRVNWRDQLRRFIDGTSTRDFSWAKPNRRLLPMRVITPSQTSDSISCLFVGVDTSGSIDGEILRDFASELSGIFGDGLVDRIVVAYADARVAHVDEFDRGDELVINAAGGGGTAFSDTFRLLRDKYPDAVCAIYMTDLFVSDFGDDPDIPVMWAVHGRTRDFDKLSYPFGEAIDISA